MERGKAFQKLWLLSTSFIEDKGVQIRHGEVSFILAFQLSFTCPDYTGV